MSFGRNKRRALADRIQALEAQVTPSGTNEAPGIGRRGFLSKIVPASAAGIGLGAIGALASPGAAFGAAGDPVLLGEINAAGTITTEIDATTAQDAATVYATNSGLGSAVLGVSVGLPAAVSGINQGAGSAVAGTDNGKGTGPAVLGTLTNTANTSTAIEASTAGSGTALTAVSAGGRGALLQGPMASVNLVPSNAAIHPASGKAGDLFVDKSHRLWYCKGGTNWHQLA